MRRSPSSPPISIGSRAAAPCSRAAPARRMSSTASCGETGPSPPWRRCSFSRRRSVSATTCDRPASNSAAFEDARQLVHTVIFDIQPKMESIAATLPLRQTLIEQTMRYLESVSRDAGDNVDLLLELSNAYQQLARVQGDVTSRASAGHGRGGAVRARRRAHDACRRARTGKPGRAQGCRASLLTARGLPEHAEPAR